MVKVFFSILWGFADIILLILLVPVVVTLLVMLVDFIEGKLRKEKSWKRREEKEEK